MNDHNHAANSDHLFQAVAEMSATIKKLQVRVEVLENQLKLLSPKRRRTFIKPIIATLFILGAISGTLVGAFLYAQGTGLFAWPN